jgi:magnesium-transporting ATPase (P-type)
MAGATAAAANKAEEDPTPLQDKLEHIATTIGNIGIGASVLTLVASITRIVFEMNDSIPCGCTNLLSCEAVADCKPYSFEFNLENRLWTDLMTAFIVIISVIVAAVPEGLPLAVTIALSAASGEMYKE